MARRRWSSGSRKMVQLFIGGFKMKLGMVRVIVLGLLFSMSLALQQVHAKVETQKGMHRNPAQQRLLGGDWPISMFLDPIGARDIYGEWSIGRNDQILKISPVDSEIHEVVWVELRRAQDDKILAQGLVHQQNEFFSGLIRYGTSSRSRWKRVLIGLGRYNEGDLPNFYFLEEQVGSSDFGTFMMKRTRNFQSEVVFDENGNWVKIFLFPEVGGDGADLFDKMVGGVTDGSMYKKEVVSRTGEFSLTCMTIKEINRPNCMLEFTRGSHTVIDSSRQWVQFRVDGDEGERLSQSFYGDFQGRGLKLDIKTGAKNFSVEYLGQ